MLASGVTSGSLLLTSLGYVDKYLGSSITTEGDFLLHFAIAALTFVVGLGGILVIARGVLLLPNHGFAGRLLLGLERGVAILGLLFSMAEALYVSGFSAPVFHQSYFALYWLGAIPAMMSILLSRRAQHKHEELVRQRQPEEGVTCVLSGIIREEGLFGCGYLPVTTFLPVKNL